MGDLLLERGPSGFNDSGARQSSMRLGRRVTRLEISSLAGGTADYGPCSQNRQPDIIIFTFSQSDFPDSIWFGSYRREQVESKLQISMFA